MILEWWLTTAAAPYSWSEPTAWSSERLYSWGESQGDSDLLSDSADWVDKYYRCQSVRLNGKAGAQFYNARYYNVYVSLSSLANQGHADIKNEAGKNKQSCEHS